MAARSLRFGFLWILLAMLLAAPVVTADDADILIEADKPAKVKDPDKAKQPVKKEKSGTCGRRPLGTAVMWTENARRAVILARKEKKLVFMMHLSGDFAREAAT